MPKIMLFSLENVKNAERLSHYDCHIFGGNFSTWTKPESIFHIKEELQRFPCFHANKCIIYTYIFFNDERRLISAIFCMNMSVCCMSSSVNNSPEQITSPNLWRFPTRKSCKLVANSQARTTRQD